MIPDYWEKWLTPVNGYRILKSAELNSLTGKIKKDTIIYTVYGPVGDGFYDCVRTLKEAQALARSLDKPSND